MKSFAAAATTFAAIASATRTAVADPVVYDMPEYSSYEATSYDNYYYEDTYDYDYPVTVPTGDFYGQVDDFNAWDTVFDQISYEERLNTEADMMVALEALREALVDVDRDIDDLDDCISDNDHRISDNEGRIYDNDHGIEDNDDEIEDQQKRVERLQRQCRRCQNAIDEDRDALVLYCQQFAFATDMVGACADVLTCNETMLPYRADVFSVPKNVY